ncbi:hypothetical protein NDU88_004932 [Pleurodeles waltl]|uniref:Uncharacterized protein n=1 Tax=Pleurodeles waltl TaxID=8319 RepID=A0AAV7T9W4_PLEWA|nr:hypothetical protein NDU88_004932 [Pleurodeles waltl]
MDGCLAANPDKRARALSNVSWPSLPRAYSRPGPCSPPLAEVEKGWSQDWQWCCVVGVLAALERPLPMRRERLLLLGLGRPDHVLELNVAATNVARAVRSCSEST